MLEGDKPGNMVIDLPITRSRSTSRFISMISFSGKIHNPVLGVRKTVVFLGRPVPRAA